MFILSNSIIRLHKILRNYLTENLRENFQTRIYEKQKSCFLGQKYVILIGNHTFLTLKHIVMLVNIYVFSSKYMLYYAQKCLFLNEKPSFLETKNNRLFYK